MDARRPSSDLCSAISVSQLMAHHSTAVLSGSVARVCALRSSLCELRSDLRRPGVVSLSLCCIV